MSYSPRGSGMSTELAKQKSKVLSSVDADAMLKQPASTRSDIGPVCVPIELLSTCLNPE